MAEEILGARLRGPRRRLGPRLPASRERDRADRGGPRQPLARIWMHNGMVRLEGEKMAKSVGNIFLLDEALEQAGRDALVMYFVSRHYRQPIAYSRTPWRRPRRPWSACATSRAGSTPTRPRRGSRRTRSASSTPWRTTSTRRRRGRPFSTGSATPTAASTRARRLARARCRDAAACSGSRTCSKPRRPRRRGRAAAGRARGRARSARLRTADARRDELAALGWTVRDTPEGPKLVRSG